MHARKNKCGADVRLLGRVAQLNQSELFCRAHEHFLKKYIFGFFMSIIKSAEYSNRVTWSFERL